MRRFIFAVLAGGLGLLLFVGVAESLLRLSPITPRIQIVDMAARGAAVGPDGRPDDSRGQARMSLHTEVTESGVPVFYQRFIEDRWRLDCRPGEDAVRVAAMGSSILAGHTLGANGSAEHIWSAVLHRALNDVRPACVSNFAAAGFSFDNQWEIATRHLAQTAPDVVYWEIWTNSPKRWHVVGERAYRFGALAPDETLLPNPFGVPERLHRVAFERSRLWEAVSIGLAQKPQKTPDHEAWPTFANERLPYAHALVEGLGAELVLVLAPSLHRPFSEQIADRRTTPIRDPYLHVVAWAEAEGVAVIRLDEALVDHAVEDIRLDPCCHYNARGQALLAGVLEEDVRSRWQPSNEAHEEDGRP